MLGSRVQHETQKGIYNGNTDYAGKVICGCCGANYIASSSDYLVSEGRKVRNYACATKRKLSFDKDGMRDFLCNNPNVYESALDEYINGSYYTFKLLLRMQRGTLVLNGMLAALEARIDRQSVAEVNFFQEELDKITSKKSKLLGLYLEDSFNKAELDERLQPLNEQESELKDKIKMLSRSNDEIYRDISEVEETLSHLQAQIVIKEQDLERPGCYRKYSREEMLADIDSIVIMPDKEMIIKFKAYKDIDQMLAKHRHILPRETQEKFFSDYL